MSTSLINPVFHADDSAGRPLVGGRLRTYRAGTSTPAVTYRDSANTPNANPIILNGRGEAMVYLDGTIQYKLVLEDAKGIIVWSADNVVSADFYANLILPKAVDASVAAVQPYVILAQEAQRGAEAARDGAILGAHIYPDEPTGRAAVSDNETFNVQGDGNTIAVYQYRRINSASSVLLAKIPASQAVADLQQMISQIDGPQAAFEFVDMFDQVIAILYTDGTLSTRLLQLLGSDLPIEGGQLGLAVRDQNGFLPVRFDADKSFLYGTNIEPSTDGSIALVDQNGFVLLYIGPAGRIGIDPEPSPVATGQRDLGAQVRTSVMHMLCYGQSLSRGKESLPPISTTQPYSNVMLASGAKSRPGDAGYDPSSFVPLTETVVDTDGESPLSGCLNGIVRRAVAEGSTASRWVFLGNASGQSGRTVQQLAQGGSSGRFEQTVQLIRDAKALCDSQGKSYSFWGMTWFQGENDYAEESLDRWPYDYVERWLSELWQPLKNQAAAITGQKFDPYLYTYQVAAHRRYGRDDMPIALAQWRASRMYDDVVMVAPCYMFPTVADGIHLTNEGSWLIGEYHARAIYQTMIRRSGKWRPLEPTAVDWQGQTIKIKFHVPAGQLVIDNALVAAYENAGFILRNGSDAVIAGGITSVSVTGQNEITINTTTGIPDDAKLTYARGQAGDSGGPVTGPRGNVRDTAGLYDKATSPLGNEFALHNACVMFEYSRKNGF